MISETGTIPAPREITKQEMLERFQRAIAAGEIGLKSFAIETGIVPRDDRELAFAMDVIRWSWSRAFMPAIQGIA